MATRSSSWGRLATVVAVSLLAGVAVIPAAFRAQAAAAPGFHFESVCRSDPAVRKNTVTVILHDDVHNGLADVTVNVLWTYVDYRQNHAVFRYKQESCTTATDGSCVFHGGSGRARWQLSEVVGYDLSDPWFDTEPTSACPNTFMIDFW